MFLQKDPAPPKRAHYAPPERPTESTPCSSRETQHLQSMLPEKSWESHSPATQEQAAGILDHHVHTANPLTHIRTCSHMYLYTDMHTGLHAGV